MNYARGLIKMRVFKHRAFYFLFGFLVSFSGLVKADFFIRSAIQPEKSELNEDTSEVQKLYDSTNKYYNLGQFDIAAQYANLIKTKSEKIDFKKGRAVAQKWFGYIYMDDGKINLAIEHFKNALEIYKNIKDDIGVVKIYNILGDIYYRMSDFNIALDYYVKALNISERKKNKNGISISYNNLGLIYNSQGDYDKAIINYSKSIAIKKTLNNKHSLAITYNNIARTYLAKNQYDTATHFFDLAYHINILLGDSNKVGEYHWFIGNIGYEKGDYLNAVNSHTTALRIFEKNKNLLRSAQCNLALGKDYLKLHKNKSAEKLLNNALTRGINLKMKGLIMDAYLNLSFLKNDEKEYKSALNYHKLYTEIKDSIFNEETRNKIIEINEKYESAKKDKAIAELNLEKRRIIAENNLKTIARENRTTILFIVTVSVSILLLLLYVIFNIKQQKERQKEFTAQLIESQEEERKRISKDLHDGIGQNLLIIKNACKEQVPLIETTIDELRNISRNMHPVQLEKLGFKKAVESIIQEAARNSKILFTYEVDDVDLLLPPNQQINLFRIIQECISNILKHAETSAAKILVLKNGNKIETSIYDKGKGFDIKQSKKKKTLGITSITERVELMDGKLTINSNDKGTRIEITLKHA